MTILLVILYVLVCLFLIMVVLLQQGKGADLAGAFGGGGSQTSFGPRSGTNLMHRMTTASFVLFVILSMALAIISGKARTSVMENLPAEPVVAVETEQETQPGMDAAEGEEMPAETAVEAPVAATGDDAVQEPAQTPTE